MAGATIEWTNKASVLAAVAKWPAIFAQEIMDYLRLAALLAIAETKPRTPIGTGESGGNLVNSITMGEPWATNKGWKIAYGSPLAHAAVIERGRGAGKTPPPEAPIARWLWIKRRHFDSLSGIDGPDDPALLRLARIIAINIGRRGFATAPDGPGKGWGMFDKGLAATKDARMALLVQTRNRIVQRCNG